MAEQPMRRGSSGDDPGGHEQPSAESVERLRIAGLTAGLAAVRGRRRRRRFGRGATLIVCLGALAIGLHRPDSPANGVSNTSAANHPARVKGTMTRIRRVATIDGLADRMAAPTTPSSIVRVRSGSHTVAPLDDRELGDWLRAAGLAPARIRIGERVVVPGLDELTAEE